MFATVLAGLLALVVLAVVRPAGPLDQHDLADQRDGLLDSGPMVPAQVGPVPFGGRPVVLLFLREPPDQRQLATWLAGLPDTADPVLVIQSPTTATAVPTWPARIITDPQQLLATAVTVPTPKDSGPGIGYAVVDSGRVVRYSPLDPRWYDNAFEVATIVGATR